MDATLADMALGAQTVLCGDPDCALPWAVSVYASRTAAALRALDQSTLHGRYCKAHAQGAARGLRSHGHEVVLIDLVDYETVSV